MLHSFSPGKRRDDAAPGSQNAREKWRSNAEREQHGAEPGADGRYRPREECAGGAERWGQEGSEEQVQNKVRTCWHCKCENQKRSLQQATKTIAEAATGTADVEAEPRLEADGVDPPRSQRTACAPIRSRKTNRSRGSEGGRVPRTRRRRHPRRLPEAGAARNSGSTTSSPRAVRFGRTTLTARPKIEKGERAKNTFTRKDLNMMF